jgi:PAS domain S-box-containing protein
MKTKILEYIDFEKVNTLLEGFNQSTGFVTAILDLDGNILSKSGWRQICTEFHRVNFETSQRCRISDTILAGKLAEGEKYHFYKCLNGLVDIAVPIIIRGEHIANLFSGQFFFEEPDSSFFQKQAAEFDFNESVYMKALGDVPVIPEEKVKTVMEFLLSMTYLISDMTFQRLELMELNEALRINEERYRLVQENSMDAILLTSPDGTILSANQAACIMFQRSEEEIFQTGGNGLMDLNDPRLPVLIEERDRNGKVKGELLMIRKDGTRFPVELSTSVFTDQNGIPRSSMIIRDITERKVSEEQLIIAKEKAEESDRLKTAFLQNMSHEIRTPMNAIMGFSDLLVNNSNINKVQKFSEIISQRCNDLLDIINDLLDISKIESGQLPVNLQESDLSELFTELTSFFKEYQKRIDKKQIKFNMQPFTASDENKIITDNVKLKQVLINLISNAFKFTEEGKVEVGCKFDENQNLLFYVSDTGYGIPLEKQEIIFERFIQLKQSSKKNIGGTGLGLPIVKALVNLLGGQVFLESEPGKGSTFSFTIPFKTGHELQHKLSKPECNEVKTFINKTILIVEDDLYNTEYLKEVLSGYGLNLLYTEYGKDAIDISIAQQIDLVLMDIRLPDINGYEATRQIRNYKPNLKIVAQTAFAAQDEKQKALDAGCNDYISKPTRQEMLLSMIRKYLLK